MIGTPARLVGLLCMFLVLAADTASAQEWGVVRRTFTFPATRLTVAIHADAPGELQIVRGGFGAVDVAARAERGLAGMALGGRRGDELVLTAMGAERVQYLVMVPEGARVRVLMPGRPFAEVFWPPRERASFAWGEARAAVSAPPPSTGEDGLNGYAPAPNSAGEDRLNGHARDPLPRVPSGTDERYVSYAAPVAPALLEIPAAAAVRTLTVRVEGDAFRVETERPMGFTGGSARHIALKPTGEPMDVVVVVPATAELFRLRIGQDEVLRIRDGRAAALCEPVLEQRLDGDRRWYTFTPQTGALRCVQS